MSPSSTEKKKKKRSKRNMELKSKVFEKVPSVWMNLIIGVVSLIAGVIGLLTPQMRMGSFVLIIGVALCVFCLCSIVLGVLGRGFRRFYSTCIAEGLIAVVLGVLAFCFMDLLAKYLPTLLGFVLIVVGIAQLVRSLLLGKRGWKQWWLGVIVAVLLIVVGLFALLRPTFTGKVIGVVMGLAAVVNGVSNLIAFVTVIRKRDVT